MIIPGVVAGAASGGGGYVAKAVHSDGSAVIACPTPFPANDTKFVYSQWMRCNADQASTGNEWLISYPHGYFSVFFQGNSNRGVALEFDGLNGNNTFFCATNMSDGNYHHMVVSVDVVAPTIQVYVDGLSDPGVGGNFGAPEIAFNHSDRGSETGVQVFTDGTTFNLAGDLSQIQLYIGQTIDLSNPANLALFYNAGKEVDPAGVISALGTPSLLFDGDMTTFPTNQGSAGTFSLTAGALTDATPP